MQPTTHLVDEPTMLAYVIRRHGGPEVLEATQLPVPEPSSGEALIKVKAVSVNSFLDVSNRAGQVAFARYEFPHVLGSEHAGEILGFGPHTDSDLPTGTRVAVYNRITCGRCDNCIQGREEACLELGVIGVTRTGAYAQYTTVPVANLRQIPNEMTDVQASAVIVNGPLAQNQLDQAEAKEGDWVLIQAGASASGTMALRMAQHRGCRVIATSRHAWKRERLVELGADAVLDPEREDFAAAVKEATDGRGADVALINIGEPRMWEQTIESVGLRGRIVSSGAKFGEQVRFNARTFYERNQTIFGIRTGNARSTELCWAAVDQGLRPVVDRVFPLEEVREAHRYIEAGQNVGRVVLAVSVS
jgi:NADPH:quinone reductase-like Zn-dependent oxidoreductase